MPSNRRGSALGRKERARGTWQTFRLGWKPGTFSWRSASNPLPRQLRNWYSTRRSSPNCFPPIQWAYALNTTACSARQWQETRLTLSHGTRLKKTSWSGVPPANVSVQQAGTPHTRTHRHLPSNPRKKTWQVLARIWNNFFNFLILNIVFYKAILTLLQLHIPL